MPLTGRGEEGAGAEQGARRRPGSGGGAGRKRATERSSAEAAPAA